MLRSRETRLLSRSKAERMLDASGFEECARILTDSGYPDMSRMNAGEIDAALSARRADIFDELAKLSPDKRIVNIFRLKYDYHNAKTIIKAEAMSQSAERVMSRSGSIDSRQLLSLYNEDRCRELPGNLRYAMPEAKSVLARTGNPQLADFLLDKAYLAELSETAKAVGNAFLQGYAALVIDSVNLRSAVRTLRMGKGSDFMRDALVPGGNVSVSRITAAGDRTGIAALFSHGALGKAAALGDEAAAGGSMTAFELACDNAVNAYLSSAKLISYGCEPLVAYLAAVENEITAVRMILTGRLAGIDAQVIRERLRDLYA